MKGLDKKEVTIGMRVQDGNANTGTVKWLGRMEKAAKPPHNDVGTYAAIEFDVPNGKLDRTDGTWEGTRYCESPPGTVEFLKPQKFFKELNAAGVAALRAKYGDKVATWHDQELIKFLIARRFEIPKVIGMMDDHFKWLNEFKPTHDEHFPEAMAEAYPVGYSDALDREGNIMYFERPGNGGKVSPKDFVKTFTIPVIMRWHSTATEMGRKRLRDGGFQSKRVTAIIDLKDLGDSDSNVMSFAKGISKMDQDHYPENLAKMFIINAPGFFTGMWTLIKFFVDERTKNKINILGAKYEPILAQHIDPQNLPSFAGGSNDSWLAAGGVCGGPDPAKAAQTRELEKAAEEATAAAQAATPKQEEEAAPAEKAESPTEAQ